MAFDLRGKRLFITGDILSETDLPPVPPFVELQLDLGEIQYMNSEGLRAWKSWSNRFRPEQRISIHNIPSFIVQRMRLHGGMLPQGAHIESLFVPMYSESLSMEKEVLMTIGKEIKLTIDSVVVQPDTSKITPQAPDWHIDVVDEGYFHFLLESDHVSRSLSAHQERTSRGFDPQTILQNRDIQPIWDEDEFRKNEVDIRVRIAKKIGKDEMERLEKVAKKIGISDPRFSRIFVKESEKSMQKRIKPSKKLFDSEV